MCECVNRDEDKNGFSVEIVSRSFFLKNFPSVSCKSSHVFSLRFIAGLIIFFFEAKKGKD